MLGVHIAETLPSLLEPDNTGVRKQYGNMERLELFALECRGCMKLLQYTIPKSV